MKEIWKEYPQDNRYKVSSIGRLKWIKGQILNQYIDNKGYFVIGLGKRKMRSHLFIAETFLNHIRCGHKVIVDHIDNNPQNNNVENLQLISHRENLIKDKRNKTSKYTGVYQKTNRKGYRSQVMLEGKMYYLGSYKTEEEANIAYIDALYEYQLTK